MDQESSRAVAFAQFSRPHSSAIERVSIEIPDLRKDWHCELSGKLPDDSIDRSLLMSRTSFEFKASELCHLTDLLREVFPDYFQARR